MIHYNSMILKRAQKKLIPESVISHFDNAFQAIEQTGDLDLFDIKRLKELGDKKRVYYRLRKGKYRAIFYMENEEIFVVTVDKREDVYRKWR
jgi:mRNA interferase RelE/StbE